LDIAQEIQRYHALSDDDLFEDLGQLALEIGPLGEAAAAMMDEAPPPSREEVREYRQGVGRTFWESFKQAAKADICREKDGLQEEIEKKGIDVALAAAVGALLSKYFGIGGELINTLVAILVVRMIRVGLNAFCLTVPDPAV
jgi:hypothetical protein